MVTNIVGFIHGFYVGFYGLIKVYIVLAAIHSYHAKQSKSKDSFIQGIHEPKQNSLVLCAYVLTSIRISE